MAKSVNKVILLGHLGRDPDPHTTPGGRLVVNFTVATNRTRRDPEGQQVEATEWFRVVVWDQLAQTAEQYLRKGAKVYLEGRLQTRRYVDKDNVERTAVEIVAHDFVMLDRRPDDAEAHAAQQQAPPPLPPIPSPLAQPSPWPSAYPATANPRAAPFATAPPPPVAGATPPATMPIHAPGAVPSAHYPTVATEVPGVIPMPVAMSPAPVASGSTAATTPRPTIAAPTSPAPLTEEDYADYDIDDENAPF